MRVAVLASGGGTTFEHVVRSRRDFDGDVAFLAVDRPCVATARAERLAVPWIETRDCDAVFGKCRQEKIDLVLCAGWLRKLPVPDDFAGKIVNVHPSLLPAFGGKGMYGMKVHEAVIASGATVSGCTVHFVDENYDTGPIVLQRSIRVTPETTPEELNRLVQIEEKIACVEALTIFRKAVTRRS